MELVKYKLRDIFKLLHEPNNERFFGNLVMMTFNDENYTCALSDESVRYGTDNYDLFEKSVKKDFPTHVAEQILDYDITIVLGRPSFVALDTVIYYYEDAEKTGEKIPLYVNAYPKDEFEETKMYKSGKCC